jgi:nuclear GTP-binding protein
MPPKQIKTKSNASSNPHRQADKKGMRDKGTIQRLNMYNSGKPIRNKAGRLVGGQFMMDNKAGGQAITAATGRIAPDRRWFGNTRTISQNELDKFKEEMTTKAADPYSIILRRKKIPMALLQDSSKMAKVNILETESFDDVFGGKKGRKRPKLESSTMDYETLSKNATARSEMYSNSSTVDSNIEVEQGRSGRDLRKEDLFSKGQSRRIWAELYKV